MFQVPELESVTSQGTRTYDHQQFSYIYLVHVYYARSHEK